MLVSSATLWMNSLLDSPCSCLNLKDSLPSDNLLNVNSTTLSTLFVPLLSILMLAGITMFILFLLTSYLIPVSSILALSLLSSSWATSVILRLILSYPIIASCSSVNFSKTAFDCTPFAKSLFFFKVLRLSSTEVLP